MRIPCATHHVACFQYRDDAERFYEALQHRLAKFGLEVATEKTRIIEFGRYAAEAARCRGERKPATFDFLGFTHYCGRSRKGWFRVKRKTSRKKLRAKLKAFSVWLQANRHLPLQELWSTVNAKLRGHYQYYGVTDNFKSLQTYCYHVRLLCFKWLNRRSQRNSLSAVEFNRMQERYPLVQPKIYVHLYPRFREEAHAGSRMR